MLVSEPCMIRQRSGTGSVSRGNDRRRARAPAADRPAAEELQRLALPGRRWITSSPGLRSGGSFTSSDGGVLRERQAREEERARERYSPAHTFCSVDPLNGDWGHCT